MRSHQAGMRRFSLVSYPKGLADACGCPVLAGSAQGNSVQPTWATPRCRFDTSHPAILPAARDRAASLTQVILPSCPAARGLASPPLPTLSNL